MSCELAKTGFDYGAPVSIKTETEPVVLDQESALQQIENVLVLGSAGFKDGVAGSMITRNDKTNRLRLSREGKAQAKAIWETVSNLALQTNEIDVEELSALFAEKLGENVGTRLLRRSLTGRANWEQTRALYKIFEQQDPEELFEAKYCPELGRSLAGAARLQYELSQIIKEKELESGEKLSMQAEIEQFNSILKEEAEREAQKAQALMKQERLPQGLWQRAKKGWISFKREAEKNGWLKTSLPHLKKLGYAACVGVVIAVSLSGAVAPVLEATHDNDNHFLDTENAGRLADNTEIPTTLSESTTQVDSPVGIVSIGGQAKTEKGVTLNESFVQATAKTILSRLLDKEEEPQKDRNPITPRIKIGPIKTGDTIGIKADGKSHQVTVQEGKHDQPFDAILAGRPDSLDSGENDEFTLLRIHSGQIKGEKDGERIVLPGTDIDRAVESGRPIFLEINGKIFQFALDGQPLVMNADAYRKIRLNDGYEGIKQILGERSNTEGRRVVIDYCDGLYNKKTGKFPFAKLISGRLVPHIPDTIQANGRTLPERV